MQNISQKHKITINNNRVTVDFNRITSQYYIDRHERIHDRWHMVESIVLNSNNDKEALMKALALVGLTEFS